MQKDDGGYAFPTNPTFYGHECDGMTLRDYFAAKAMESLCMVNQGNMPEPACQQAYVWADAMLKARGE